jgi:hypothetical protein
MANALYKWIYDQLNSNQESINIDFARVLLAGLDVNAKLQITIGTHGRFEDRKYIEDMGNVGALVAIGMLQELESSKDYVFDRGHHSIAYSGPIENHKIVLVTHNNSKTKEKYTTIDYKVSRQNIEEPTLRKILHKLLN